MGTIRSVLFRAPLDSYLDHGVMQFNIDQPELKAFLTYYKNGRWALMFTDGKERNETELRSAIYQAIGENDLEVEIITTGTWEMSMLVADKFRSGRVFLAGDSAHALPPNRGGFGANTGVGDAWNLGWKLAAVLSATSEPILLDTYEQERRPIALLRKQQILLRDDHKFHVPVASVEGQVLDDVAMEVGEIYRSAGIVGATQDLPPARRPEEWKGQPGTRLAHSWLSRNGERVSSLDLFGKNWVLICGSDEWREAAGKLNLCCSVRISPLVLGADISAEEPANFQELLGISSGGASLIRPDGIIAWRCVDSPDDALSRLEEAVSATSFPVRC